MAAIGCQRLLLFTENRRYCRSRNNESRGLMLTRRKFLATTACTVAAAHLHVQAQGEVLGGDVGGRQEAGGVPSSDGLDLPVRHRDGHQYAGTGRGGSGVCS